MVNFWQRKVFHNVNYMKTKQEISPLFIATVNDLIEKKIIRNRKEVVDILEWSESGLSNVMAGRRPVPHDKAAKLFTLYKIDNTYSPKYTEAVLLDLGNSIVMQVPLVTPYAYAGYMKGYGDAVFMDSLPRIPFIVEKEHKGNYIAIEVSGESMDNGTRAGYIAGDILLCREVPQQHWRDKLHIKKWDFVIATKTDGVLVKQISKHNAATGDITLHSLNPEYEDIQVNLNDVAKIFNVVQVSYKK